MRPDESRIEGDRKTTKASGPEVVDEEIYLIPGRYKWGKKLRKRRGKTEGWHSLKSRAPARSDSVDARSRAFPILDLLAQKHWAKTI